jgi:hypothetical protein
MMCDNYHGISLLNMVYKVFSVTLFQRLQATVETSIGNYQCGFRSGKSTSDLWEPPTVQQEQVIFIHHILQLGCLCINTSTTESAPTVKAPVLIG